MYIYLLKCRSTAPTIKAINALKKKYPTPPAIRNTFTDWNRAAEVYAFNKRLSEKFQTEKLEEAFTDRSYIIKEESKLKDLGVEDSKLDLQSNDALADKGLNIVSTYIYEYLKKALPKLCEDGLSTLTNYLISEDVLANASLHLGTKDIILCAEYPASKDILAKTFLALVGALAESADKNHAGLFVRDFLITALASKDLSELYSPANPLETLNKILMDDKGEPAEPRLISRTGDSTLIPAYQVAVYTNKKFLGSGWGQTIAEAKEAAAVDALNRIYGITDSSTPIKYNKEINVFSA
ncbi:large ribosomal subunit protein mL44 isoform X2 [Prorops nasuta]|uniref:large ribosomal subunit protein mL44 isoform X2 n=1 Tax=Prorops nasuta TaxID=863751 RepID=UPI0034CD83EF